MPSIEKSSHPNNFLITRSHLTAILMGLCTLLYTPNGSSNNTSVGIKADKYEDQATQSLNKLEIPIANKKGVVKYIRQFANWICKYPTKGGREKWLLENANQMHNILPTESIDRTFLCKPPSNNNMHYDIPSSGCLFIGTREDGEIVSFHK